MKEHVYHTLTGEIYYWTYRTQTEQNPSNLWLVFLPGLTANNQLFDQQIATFQEKYHCLVWDAPAHGASRPFTLHFTLDDMAHYLHDILEVEQVENFILIGQSMGGYIAQVYEQQYSGKTKGIVSIDSAPIQKEYYAKWEIISLKYTEGMYKSFPWKLLVNMSVTGNAETAYGQGCMRNIMLDYEKYEFCRLAGHGFRILAEKIEQDDEAKITCPVLLLCGENDQAGFVKRYNEMWTKRTGYPLVWIPNAGHISNIDNPEAVNAQIQHFVKFVEEKIK